MEETVVPPVVPPVIITEPPKDRKLLIIAGVIVVSVIILSLTVIITILIVLNRQKPVSVEIIPSPTPVEIMPTIPVTPSKFATDAALLKLSTDIQTLRGKVDSIDLVEPEITPPNLDLRINIQPANWNSSCWRPSAGPLRREASEPR